MSKTIRKLALAVASAVVSLGALAGPVTFEGLGATDSEGVAIGTITVDSVSYSFSGATAWTNRGFANKTSNVYDPVQDLPTASNIFASTQLPDGTNQSSGIGVTVAGKDIESVTFANWVSGSGAKIFVNAFLRSNDGTDEDYSADFTLSQGAVWSLGQVVDLPTDGVWNRVEFRPSVGVLLIDNMDFIFGATTTPTVPEPESYGLVALALLAAGAASRRRKA